MKHLVVSLFAALFVAVVAAGCCSTAKCDKAGKEACAVVCKDKCAVDGKCAKECKEACGKAKCDKACPKAAEAPATK
jgi:outer membrane murein-binding lipoprotein Lpp